MPLIISFIRLGITHLLAVKAVFYDYCIVKTVEKKKEGNTVRGDIRYNNNLTIPYHVLSLVLKSNHS